MTGTGGHHGAGLLGVHEELEELLDDLGRRPFVRHLIEHVQSAPPDAEVDVFEGLEEGLLVCSELLCSALHHGDAAQRVEREVAHVGLLQVGVLAVRLDAKELPEVPARRQGQGGRGGVILQQYERQRRGRCTGSAVVAHWCSRHYGSGEKSGRQRVISCATITRCPCHFSECAGGGRDLPDAVHDEFVSPLRVATVVRVEAAQVVEQVDGLKENGVPARRQEHNATL